MHRAWWLFVVMAALLGACGGPGETVESEETFDLATAEVAEELRILPQDILDEEPLVVPEIVAAETVDADLWSGPGPGEPGHPCEVGADCDSGYCIQTGEGRQCTMTCEEECPFDWLCTLYTPSLPDTLYLCVPAFVEHCRPCYTNADCFSDGVDAGQACVVYGEAGNFCGSQCTSDDDCPSGTECIEATDTSDGTSLQCVRTAGECECRPWHADDGAGTVCYVANEFGSCFGDRVCKATGLTDCDAATPMAESCNGIDDDCDEAVDEDTGGNDCFVTNQFGSCPGTDACVGGKLVCEGDEPHAETCDGEDNDCDGQTDEGFEDTDKDGIADCLEADIDGDGIPDVQDNCPGKHNPTQLDTDLDNFGNACDADDDNDKTADEDDCAPLDAEVHPGADELCNGQDDNCNFLVDEGFVDTDADGWKDCVDTDDDDDGTVDDEDCQPLDGTIHPLAAELCDAIDNDCDGQVDEGFPDSDGDKVPDCADDDQDGDGIPDVEDNCPATANELQEDLDQDTLGDLCDPDLDGDGIPNALDNCPTVFNPGQGDSEKDTVGDACDPDMDNDDIDNEEDNCPLHYNPEQEDQDEDGTGDACEDDKDGDGALDNVDCAPADPAVHPGAQELCDGIDNNCNGALDEGFPDADADGVKNCLDNDDDDDGDPDDADCAPLNPAIHHDAEETCNGKDDDCSGVVDDGLGKLTCGKGECAHSVPACVAGKPQSCDPFEGIAVEICDGKDNDCNGLTDEGLGSTTCGLGVCHHTVANCLQGVPQSCEPMEGASPQEECDGLDNDCDGKTDEDQPTLACGKGACFHTVPSCVGGVSYECNPFEGALPEVCDGVDNDCDGQIDEGLGTVLCGVGACQHEMDYCQEGKVAVCNPYLGVTPEVCDGKDNDCDGLTDEDQPKVTCGLGQCYQQLTGCVDGQIPECDPLAGSEAESCDGKDNDCDGQIDEALGYFTCGVGVCLHTVPKCLDGETQACDPMEGAGDETCNGLDDDCDGEADPENAEGCQPWYLDLDEDGYGDPGTDHCLCDAEAPYTADNDLDCDDGDGGIHPGLDEDCNNLIDDNCDGEVNEGCTYLSCKALLALIPEAPDGAYMLDVDGEEGAKAPFEAWCDMTTDGGGWTLLLKTSSASGYVYDNAVWSQADGGSSEAPAPDLDEDFVSKAFYHLESTESRVALGGQTHWNSWNHAKNTARNLCNQGRMSGSYGAASTCPARTNCGTEPINKRPLGLQEATSASYSNKWNRFGYVNDVNGWGTKTRVGFTGDNDGSDSSDSIMGLGLSCTSSCLGGSCTGAPHNMGSGFYLYVSWADAPLDGAVRGWLWMR